MKIRVIEHPTKSFTLFPLSDVHWPLHDHDKLKSWREAVLSDPRGLVTLGGDLFDFARGKYRAHLQSYVADENSRNPLDEQAYGWIEAFVDFLRPIKDRIILTCVGNHHWRFQNGRVSDQELAIQLGVANTFVGAFGMARIDLKGRAKIRIALHHDAGRKGGTASSDLLAFQHWSHGCASDIYIAGHTHRQYAGIFHTRITVRDDEDKIGDQKLVFIRSGAFLKGYVDSIADDPLAPFNPDYAEVMMLPPSVLGIISVNVEATPVGRLKYTLQQRTL